MKSRHSTPDRMAVTFGDRHLTYRELQAQASQLAHRLRGLGVGPETLVGVHLERSAQAIVALLAVVKAGGAYLPLDPAYPGERLATILNDARPAVLLTEEHLLDRLPSHGAHTICLDREPAMDSSPEDVGFEPGAGEENLAYVIYTSGSTGKPKGVMVTHGNVARLLSATTEWFHFNEAMSGRSFIPWPSISRSGRYGAACCTVEDWSLFPSPSPARRRIFMSYW